MKHNLYKVYNKIVRVLLRRSVAKQLSRANDLEGYQKKDIIKVLNIIYKYFKRPNYINVLDIGCDAKEVTFMAKYVRKILGININEQYLDNRNICDEIELFVMDATKLELEDNSFDFVYSLNLFEHILDLNKCLDEQIRVLKPSGYCYASWYPVWSGPRGHHIHEDMVEYWKKCLSIKEQEYSNDGTYIKDWSHLLLSREEMKKLLSNNIKNEKLIDQIVDFIYCSNELNRLFFDEFLAMIKMKRIKIEFLQRSAVNIPSSILNQLRDLYNYSDFDTSGCQILFSKSREESPQIGSFVQGSKGQPVTKLAGDGKCGLE